MYDAMLSVVTRCLASPVVCAAWLLPDLLYFVFNTTMVSSARASSAVWPFSSLCSLSPPCACTEPVRCLGAKVSGGDGIVRRPDGCVTAGRLSVRMAAAHGLQRIVIQWVERRSFGRRAGWPCAVSQCQRSVHETACARTLWECGGRATARRADGRPWLRRLPG